MAHYASIPPSLVEKKERQYSSNTSDGLMTSATCSMRQRTARPSTVLAPKRNSKKRARTQSSSSASSSSVASLLCYVVDDHCDALKYIHKAIRRGTLPFSGLRMMHFDAHPDLMITADMPAEVCFRPHDLYDALGEAEGGIAEWILPMVYQGHLSKVWWVKPPWAQQFLDGAYRFCVGQVKDTGELRVNSTAPYFVDDRLYCPQADMQNCKTLDLFVSTVTSTQEKNGNLPRDGDFCPIKERSATPQINSTVTTAAESSRSVLGTAVEYPHFSETSAAEKRQQIAAATVCVDGVVGRKDPRETGSLDSAVGAITGVGACGMAATDAGGTVSLEGSDRGRPWILDICLDFFTTENPFTAELESSIGTANTSLVRAFYERPLFRGAGTTLPHETQLEHERIFQEEVTRLLGVVNVSSRQVDNIQSGGRATAEAEMVNGREMGDGSEMVDAESSDSSESTGDAPNIGRCSTVSATTHTSTGLLSTVDGDFVKDAIKGDRARMPLGSERLKPLFDQDSESDRVLPERFAAMLSVMAQKERDIIAWVDHCACLPRHLATREEVSSTVSRVEDLLRSVMISERGEEWEGRPGVITVARSDDDGYVPADIAAFVENQVLAMLSRLFGGQKGGGLKVLYDEGLQSKQQA